MELDPSTNLYPFMLAAVDDSSEQLDLVYYLLRKDARVGEKKGLEVPHSKKMESKKQNQARSENTGVLYLLKLLLVKSKNISSTSICNEQ